MTRFLGESNALDKLKELRAEFHTLITERYEHRARPCVTCETRGECCLDSHFVNVRISRLEATAIIRALEELDDEKRVEVMRLVDDAIQRFSLNEDRRGVKTFACPLYDREAGCLVHETAKPLPCIHHACYARTEDLPPESLLDEAELAVERLNRRVYGRGNLPLSLPVALKKAAR